MKNNIKPSHIRIRVNPDVKDTAMTVLDEMGISLSDVFNMLLNQIAIQHRIPFEIVDSKYICAYGYLHDYSKISPPTEDDYSEPFDNFDDLWKVLEI